MIGTTRNERRRVEGVGDEDEKRDRK